MNQQQTIPVGYKQTEVGVIPENWKVKQIAQMNFDISDGNYSSKYPKSTDFKSIGIPFIRANNIKRMTVIDEGMRFITKNQHAQLTKGHLKKNDILITTRGEIGQVAFVPDKYINANINAQIVRINTANSGVSSQFFGYYLTQDNIQNSFENSQSGSALKQLPVGKLVKLLVVIPSKKEQEMIAEALSSIDSFISKLSILIQKKRRIRRGLMEDLLTGKRRLPGFNKAWKSFVLGENASFAKGKGLPKSAIVKNGDKECIHYGELFTDYSTKIAEVISRTNFDSDCVSKANDVLMPTSDVTPTGLAKASCIQKDGVILGGDILIIRPNSEIDGVFLSYQIRQQKPQVMSLVSGTTVFHLYASDMKKFEYFSPEFDEQQAIVKVLEEMKTEIDALEKQKSKYIDLKQGMMQQLLTGKIRLI